MTTSTNPQESDDARELLLEQQADLERAMRLVAQRLAALDEAADVKEVHPVRRKRRHLRSVVGWWPLAALASLAEALRSNQEAVMQYAFGGAGAATMAAVIVMPTPAHQTPQVPARTPQPAVTRPYIPPAPSPTARAKHLPVARDVDIKTPTASPKPTPEPTPTAPAPATSTPSPDTVAATPAAEPVVSPTVAAEDRCLTGVTPVDKAACPNG